MNELAVFAKARIQQKLQNYGIRYDIVEAVCNPRKRRHPIRSNQSIAGAQ